MIHILRAMLQEQKTDQWFQDWKEGLTTKEQYEKALEVMELFYNLIVWWLHDCTHLSKLTELYIKRVNLTVNKKNNKTGN